MPRTRIPDRLVHRPEEVERDADRFDHLCRLAEEVAFPIVHEALVRETATTGADVLMEEAKQALEALAEDAVSLENLDEKQMLEELQGSLSQALPPLDEEECHQHARDLSQVLMSTWLESLRAAKAEEKIVFLSDYLLPHTPSYGIKGLVERFWGAQPNLPQHLIDATASFAVNEADVAKVMNTLRVKLFPETRLVDLPFNLAVVGAPKKPVLAMGRPLYDRLSEVIGPYLEDLEPAERRAVELSAHKLISQRAEPETVSFTTPTAQRAVEVLSEPLSAGRYFCLTEVATPGSRTDRAAAKVQQEASAS